MNTSSPDFHLVCHDGAVPGCDMAPVKLGMIFDVLDSHDEMRLWRELSVILKYSMNDPGVHVSDPIEFLKDC